MMTVWGRVGWDSLFDRFLNCFSLFGNGINFSFSCTEDLSW